jgi:hypothetical protein
LTLLSGSAPAEGYILGAGAEGDSADGRAYSAFGDFSLGDKTWLSLTATTIDTEGIISDNETMLGSVGLDFALDPIGIRIGASYWGNPDILDSRDVNVSAYVRGRAGSISLDYVRRNFEFDLQSDFLRGRTETFSANGWGLNSRLALSDNVSFFFGGMVYEYSRNLRIQPDIDVLAFISRSRLSMINNLLDDRFNAGLEFKFGLQSIDVTAGRWQTAIDGSSVDSYSIGFLTPVADRLDAEFRLSYDESDAFGETTALSIYLYYFGGT